MRLIVYKAIQISLFVCDFKIFGLLSLLELVLHCHGTCTTSYLYHLVVPCVKIYRQHLFRILCAKVSNAPTLTQPFCYNIKFCNRNVKKRHYGYHSLELLTALLEYLDIYLYF